MTVLAGVLGIHGLAPGAVPSAHAGVGHEVVDGYGHFPDGVPGKPRKHKDGESGRRRG
ncbi:MULTISPECIES: DUF6153 family protein [unclassified Streptomyces]|uniref:DUF6153 family protein n=1 Tax=unclassified Streptomyces TaxID=2593676 RepID=UPI0035D6B1CF